MEPQPATLSENTLSLLNMALEAVRTEGWTIVGCYLRHNPANDPPLDLCHFSSPPLSRACMGEFVDAWLSILQDDSISCDATEASGSSFVKLTDA